MKTRTLIIFALLGIVLGSMIFYFYTYSPVYDKGIGLMYAKDSGIYAQFQDKYPIYKLQEEDYDNVPKIKYMMDVLLTTEDNGDYEYTVHPDSMNAKYEVRITSNEHSIRVGMPTSELDSYNKWVEGKSTYLFEYEDVVFLIVNWDQMS